MRTEYLLLCKKNYHSNSGSTFLNLFKKPMFVKGQKYKVVKEVITFPYSTSTTSTYPYSTTTTTIANPPYSGSTLTTTTTFASPIITTTSTTHPSSYSWTSYSINNTKISESFISGYFYTLKEERQIKLSKLKKVNEEEIL